MKKQGVAQLKKKADKYHSIATRYRFADKVGDTWYAECVTCNVRKPIKELQCGHFVSRRVNELRFSELNTAPQCYSCNVMRYGEQYKFAKWLDEFYGDGTAEELMSQRHTTHKFTIQELEDIILDSRTQIKFYEEQDARDSADS